MKPGKDERALDLMEEKIRRMLGEMQSMLATIRRAQRDMKRAREAAEAVAKTKDGRR